MNTTNLHRAAENGDVEQIRTLLAQGADVNALNGFNQTPLHCAAHACHVGATAALLEGGADALLFDAFGCAAIHTRFSDAGFAVIDLMLAHGVDIDLKTRQRMRLLTIACSIGDQGALDALLDRGARLVMMHEQQHDSPMRVAQTCAHTKLIRRMFERCGNAAYPFAPSDGSRIADVLRDLGGRRGVERLHAEYMQKQRKGGRTKSAAKRK